MQLKTRVRLATATISILLFLVQFNATAETHKIPWQMFRGDIRHTGQSNYKGGQTNELKWSYKIETRVIKV